MKAFIFDSFSNTPESRAREYKLASLWFDEIVFLDVDIQNDRFNPVGEKSIDHDAFMGIEKIKGDTSREIEKLWKPFSKKYPSSGYDEDKRSFYGYKEMIGLSEYHRIFDFAEYVNDEWPATPPEDMWKKCEKVNLEYEKLVSSHLIRLGENVSDLAKKCFDIDSKMALWDFIKQEGTGMARLSATNLEADVLKHFDGWFDKPLEKEEYETFREIGSFLLRDPAKLSWDEVIALRHARGAKAFRDKIRLLHQDAGNCTSAELIERFRDLETASLYAIHEKDYGKSMPIDMVEVWASFVLSPLPVVGTAVSVAQAEKTTLDKMVTENKFGWLHYARRARAMGKK